MMIQGTQFYNSIVYVHIYICEVYTNFKHTFLEIVPLRFIGGIILDIHISVGTTKYNFTLVKFSSESLYKIQQKPYYYLCF